MGMADSAAVAGAAGALVALSVALFPGGILLVVQSMAALAFLLETNALAERALVSRSVS